MKSVKILVEELKANGIENAEEVVVDCFKAIQSALPKIVADAETSAMEKSVAGVSMSVLGALLPTIEKLADFNKDGKIGN